MMAKVTTGVCAVLQTQISPIHDKVAKLMTMHQHLIIMTVKHISNIQEVSIEKRKSNLQHSS